jgi:hypothetical protein
MERTLAVTANDLPPAKAILSLHAAGGRLLRLERGALRWSSSPEKPAQQETA